MQLDTQRIMPLDAAQEKANYEHREEDLEEIGNWVDELGADEVSRQIASGQLVTGTIRELARMKKRLQLSVGTPNQRKKYRQLKKGKS